MDLKWVNTKKISCLFLLPPVFRACVYLYTKRELFAFLSFLSGSMDAVLFGRQLLRHTYIDKVSVCVYVPASFRCSNGQPFVWIIDSILLQPVGRELHFPVPNNMRTRNGEPCQRYESYAATGPQFLYIYIPIWSSRSTQCDASARSILIRSVQPVLTTNQPQLFYVRYCYPIQPFRFVSTIFDLIHSTIFSKK